MKFFEQIYRAILKLISLVSFGSYYDKWLLTNYPNIWRSRIIQVIWFSAATCAAGILLSYSSFEPGPPTRVPTLLEVNAVTQILLFVMLGLFLMWGASLIRLRMRAPPVRAVVVTVLTYFLGSYAILSIPVGFTQATAKRIAAVESSRSQFEERFAEFDQFNFGFCFDSRALPSDTDLTRLLSREYGSQGFTTYVVVQNCRDRNGSSVCGWPPVQGCIELIGVSEDSDEFDMHANTRSLRPRYESLQAALTFEARLESRFDFWGVLFSVSRAGMAVAATLLLTSLTILGSSPYTRMSGQSAPRLEWLNFVSWSPGWVRRLDQRMLTAKPHAWAMRSHMLILFSFLFTSLFGFGIFFHSYVTDYQFYDDEALMPYFMSGMFLLGIILGLICILYRLQFPDSLYEPKDVRNYIISFYNPFTPIMIILISFITMVVYLREYLDMVDIFGADLRLIHDATGALFFFLVGFAAGLNFTISIFISIKFFDEVNVLVKIVANAIPPFIFIAFILSIQDIELTFLAVLASLALIFLIFISFIFLSSRKENQSISFGIWLLVLPLSLMMGITLILSVDQMDGGIYSDLWNLISLLIFQVLIFFGPPFIVRFFCGPMHRSILQQAYEPKVE